jgi:hypothetical protein
VRSVDLLVVADASVPAGVVDAVRRTHPTGATLAHPAVADVDGVQVAPTPSTIDVGALSVRVVDAGERLVVEAVARPP